MPDEHKQGSPRAVMRRGGKMPRMVSSRDLMAGERLLIIRHEEQDYRLQITAAGKLILTK
jgi:hemin uptake protein HemP